MKIFFPIGAFYPSQIGGPCNTLYWHTCELAENGIEVDIVTTTLGIKEGSVKENEQVGNSWKVYYGKGNYNDMRIARKAINTLKHANVVHLNSFFDLLSISSFFYARIFYPRVKVVWSVRGQLNPEALKFSSWKKKPLIFLYRKFAKDVLFHATSEKEAQDTQRILNPKRVIQVPNFIALSYRLHLSPKKQILFVGRIHQIKGLHKLIEALSLSQAFLSDNYILKIAGVCEPRHEFYLNELKELIEKKALGGRVEFLGHIEGVQKEKLFSESFVLVLPSESENFGNVVVESLNQGTPVIASKGTPWSLLEEYNCGYHIDNSPPTIAQALDKIIKLDAAEYLELRKNAMSLVDEKFDIKSGINQWLQVYNNL